MYSLWFSSEIWDTEKQTASQITFSWWRIDSRIPTPATQQLENLNRRIYCSKKFQVYSAEFFFPSFCSPQNFPHSVLFPPSLANLGWGEVGCCSCSPERKRSWGTGAAFLHWKHHFLEPQRRRWLLSAHMNVFLLEIHSSFFKVPARKTHTRSGSLVVRTCPHLPTERWKQ